VINDQMDAVIAGLCPLFSRYADEILDLRSCARQRVRPGLCVRCYFQLYARADSATQPVLFPLRSWLESNIEVVARDNEEKVLEQLPLSLDTADLQSYCHRLMDEFRENRVYSAEVLSLEFRYKEAA
jgi:hypothetical protein